MCGIAGYLLREYVERDEQRLAAMLASISHRGPDDEGAVLVPGVGVEPVCLTAADLDAGRTRSRESRPISHALAYGHRRFSIVDLSSAGHQPMWSRQREICVCLNGEIYNFIEVREELQALGREFETSSDTEVLIEAYLEWGVDAFSRLNGIWALSIHDTRDGSLVLARDRIGKIPLYHARTSEGLFWASEIKALRAAGVVSSTEIDEQSVLDYVTTSARDLEDRTFYSGVSRFPAASWCRVSADGEVKPHTYWSIPLERRSEAEIGIEEAAQGLREILSDAVRIRLRVDVPLAFELSGGMDSSTLCALGSEHLERLSVYTVAFPGTSMNEEPYARAVAEHLGDGVEYNVLKPDGDDFFEVADSYIALMDEPFHMPNLLTNFQIWKRMHDAGVRVCINGGGGDELLAGYGGEFFRPYLRELVRSGHPLEAMREWRMYTERSPASLSRTTLERGARTALKSARRLLRGGEGLPRGVDPFVPPRGRDPWRGAATALNDRLIDMATGARMNYWLTSDNQSYMGIPLEVRMPFLDYRAIEYAFTLPVRYLIRDGWLKWILRKAMEPSLPASVTWRKQKMGFPFPLREWLPSAKSRFLSIVEGSVCPYVDAARLRTSYDLMARRTPKLLWRELCLLLWWKRCVEGEHLE